MSRWDREPRAWRGFSAPGPMTDKPSPEAEVRDIQRILQEGIPYSLVGNFPRQTAQAAVWAFKESEARIAALEQERDRLRKALAAATHDEWPPFLERVGRDLDAARSLAQKLEEALDRIERETIDVDIQLIARAALALCDAAREPEKGRRTDTNATGVDPPRPSREGGVDDDRFGAESAGDNGATSLPYTSSVKRR